MLGVIGDDADACYGGRDYRIVLLGDYVDRGPDSAGVLDRAIALDAAGHIVLPGNHEHMMWSVLTGRDAGYDALARWRRNGAASTLASYGIGDGIGDGDAFDPSVVSPVHTAFLERLFDGRPIYHVDRGDGLFFVHAGVAADQALLEQRDDVMMWSRLSQDEDPQWVEGLHVVHGHTPRRLSERLTYRTGLDTGAVYGGVLSAGVFMDGTLRKVLSAPGLDAGDVEARWR